MRECTWPCAGAQRDQHWARKTLGLQAQVVVAQCGCWVLNQSHLEEQKVLKNAEPSFQSLNIVLKYLVELLSSYKWIVSYSFSLVSSSPDTDVSSLKELEEVYKGGRLRFRCPGKQKGYHCTSGISAWFRKSYLLKLIHVQLWQNSSSPYPHPKKI